MTYTLSLACVYAVIVLSVSLLAGWAGVWSVGQPAMVAIGAYTAAFGSSHGWNLEFTILVSIVVSAACGAFLGFAGSRFSTLYIALLTLAFNLVVLEIIEHWTAVTGGDEGVPVLTLASATGLFSIPAGGPVAEYVVIGALGLASAGVVLVRRSTSRLRISAAKSHGLASRSIGVSPEAQTTIAFAASAALAGFGGVLYALLGGFVSSETASLSFGIDLIAATVVGGTGLIVGSLIGGVFLAWSPTLAGAIHVSQPILQGVILIVALILLPKGVAAPIATGLRKLFRIAHQDTMRIREGGTVPAMLSTESAGAPLLLVDGLEVRFGGLRALEKIDLAIMAGEVVCVIGPNGAGKTTFMNVLSGLLPKRSISGRIEYKGAQLPVGRATHRHRLGIARTFQHAELFSDLTVLQNVFGSMRRLNDAQIKAAWSLLADLDLLDVANSFPGDLPFGMRKRVDLARALFSAPQLLLMDEPFGGLDDHERSVMISTIKRLSDSGLTMVVIDHVLDDLRAVADRFIAFDFGTILAAGSPTEVLNDERVRAAYLGGGDVRDEKESDQREEASDLITLNNVSYSYGSVIAVESLHIGIKSGRINGIVGANGAGKSTTGKLIHGLLSPVSGDRIVAGDGKTLRISLVPEGRALFNSLSVTENLEVAGYAAGLSRTEIKAQLERWSSWLPDRVASRMGASAGALSGGEQQMVAIARALMAKPDVIILDEPALGLAPTLVDEVYARIADLARAGMTVVLLEQLLARAVATCDSVVVVRDGRVQLTGSRTDPNFESLAEEAYFGSMTKLTV
ncbi:ATP-binding cassette domain-containing protein [Cryobacterium sp. TMS1-20-1]|uniref:ATP-binding cassette domain-containing protein n=1 Tax=Cryobacterium sp. TMS1-20-1 TaxID=1259223 RepID=UPI0018E07A37|nr:ATP-binding cassette domain-containing protein [Cryobacterium sp. TMS1-20-1]